MGERGSAGALGTNSCPLVLTCSQQPRGTRARPWWQWGILRDPEEEGESGSGDQGLSPSGLDLDFNFTFVVIVKEGNGLPQRLKELEDSGCFSFRKWSPGGYLNSLCLSFPVCVGGGGGGRGDNQAWDLPVTKGQLLKIESTLGSIWEKHVQNIPHVLRYRKIHC